MTDRFWSKVAESGDCWVWTRSVNSKGYGLYGIEGRLHLAHRVAYEAMVAEIPPGLVIDHLCSVRRCVKPSHLEPVTTRENNVRAAHRGFATSTPEYQAIHLAELPPTFVRVNWGDEWADELAATVMAWSKRVA